MPFSSTVISSGPYAPNGITTNFPYFFEALSAGEVQVVLTDGDGVETVLTSGFDIHDIGNPTGGVVIFTEPLVNDGRSLTIRANPSFTQEIDFLNQGAFNPSEINQGLDRAAQRDLYLYQLILAGGITPGGGGPSGPVDWSAISNKPTTFAPSPHVHDATDITSGILATARIPNLDASKITSGSFNAARIPSLDASKITSGTIDPARLPAGSTGIVSSGAIADLTAPQQATIVEGTLVTTTDGQRWVYSGTGSKVLEASYINIGDSSPDWSVIANKPVNVTSLVGLVSAADRLAYFTDNAGSMALATFTATGRTLVALGSQGAAIAYTSPLTTKGDLYTYSNQPARLPVGSNGQTLVADSTQTTGLRWATPSSPAGMFNEANFVSVFSGNPDGSTNNDAAFTAAEASAYDRIYLPEGYYLTTLLISQLSKHYVGPGHIHSASGYYPNFSRYSTEVHPTVSVDTEYGFSEDLSFGEAEHYIINTGMRKNLDRYLTGVSPPNGYPPYFWAPATPHFLRFTNKGGWSGFSGATSNPILAGVSTSVNIVGGTTGWNIGDTVGFTNTMDGLVTETRVLTGVGGGVISWSGALTNTYPTGSVVTHGYRTMNTAYFTHVDHSGGGDAYIHTARMEVSFAKLSSQVSFEQIATGGLFGGELVISAPGCFGTGWESQYHDNGVSGSGIIARVESYVRKNNDGLYNSVWLHDRPKMDGGGTGYLAYGLQPIDGLYATAVACRTGFDFTASRASVAAVALPLGEKIGFDAAIVSPGAGNGNGFVATTINGMYIAGHATDGTSKYIEMTAGGTNTVKIRPDYLETTKFLGTAVSGVSPNIKLSMAGIVASPTYFIYDNSANLVALYKNNVQVAVW